MWYNLDMEALRSIQASYGVSAEQFELQREHPAELPVMYHHWRDLLFMHYPVDPEVLRPMIPPDLTLDTFPDASGKEMAWVGIVAFRMFGIRPKWMPPFPLLSAFPETNVRTYVHRKGEDPGVWFFSLDARPKLACWLARVWYREPYFHARMHWSREGNQVEYRSRRREGLEAWNDIQVELGDRLPPSLPGTLEYFLCERYRLYTAHRGQVLTARVWHEPYKLRAATLKKCELHMVEPLGLEQRPIEHICFCDGVDTEIFRIRRAGR
jgi:uncharacterized protein